MKVSSSSKHIINTDKLTMYFEGEYSPEGVWLDIKKLT
jgi:hypothetical protein